MHSSSGAGGHKEWDTSEHVNHWNSINDHRITQNASAQIALVCHHT